MRNSLLRPALFLDRDGTLVEEVHHLSRPEQIRLLPGASRAVRLANRRGVPVVVVTNQSAVARGLLTEEELGAVHEVLRSALERDGARLDAIYYCPHHREAVIPDYAVDCDCRKPAPGLLLRAARDLGLNLSRGVMIGDRLLDIEAGRRAGCRGVLVRTGYGASEERSLTPSDPQPDRVADDILEAVRWALRRLQSAT
jgi:D-glycero-D-manno-heptose 1,7-bisphosphate phosphatase